MRLNLRKNAIAEARFALTCALAFPDLDDDDIKEAWREFCKLAGREPLQAAIFEAEARRQSRTPLDS